MYYGRIPFIPSMCCVLDRPLALLLHMSPWEHGSSRALKTTATHNCRPLSQTKRIFGGLLGGGQAVGGEGCVLCVMHYTSDWSGGRCPQELLTNRNHSLYHRNLTRPTSAPLFINRQPPPIPHQTAHHRRRLSRNWFIMIFKKMRSLCPSSQNYNNMQMTNVLIECDCHARGNYAAHLHTSPTRAQPNISFARVPLYPASSLSREWMMLMRCDAHHLVSHLPGVLLNDPEHQEWKGKGPQLGWRCYSFEYKFIFFPSMTWQLHRRGAKIRENANYVRANKIICHRSYTRTFFSPPTPH